MYSISIYSSAIVILLTVILVFVIIIYSRKNGVVVIDEHSCMTDNSMSTSDPEYIYILKKSHINRPHIVSNRKGNTNITIPQHSEKWLGEISITNLQDVTDTLNVDVTSSVRIIEYNDKTSLYHTSEKIDGKIYNYNNVKGKIYLNNYMVNIYFANGVVYVDIHTLTVPSEPVLS